MTKCEFILYDCLNVAKTAILHDVTEANLATQCNMSGSTVFVYGDEWECTEQATISAQILNFPTTVAIATTTSTISFSTASGRVMGNIMYLQWTSSIMVMMSLGIITFLLYMKRR